LKVVKEIPQSRDRINRNLLSGRLKLKATVEGGFLFVGTGRRTFSNLPKVKVGGRLLKQVVDELCSKMGELVEEHASLDGRPVIPGSTLKGAVRSRVEHLFSPFNGSIQACYSVSRIRGMVRASRMNARHLKRYGYEEYEGSIPERERCNPPDRVCVVCDMFGAMSLASKVNFTDAVMEDGNYGSKRIRFNSKEGVYILVEEGSTFTFTVSFTNLTWEQLGLLFMGMRLHEGKPMLIGRFKYAARKVDGEQTAFGRVKISLLEAYTYTCGKSGIPEEEEKDIEGLIGEAVKKAKEKFRLRELDEEEDDGEREKARGSRGT